MMQDSIFLMPQRFVSHWLTPNFITCRDAQFGRLYNVIGRLYNVSKIMFSIFCADGNKICSIPSIIPILQSGRWYTIFIFEFIWHDLFNHFTIFGYISFIVYHVLFVIQAVDRERDAQIGRLYGVISYTIPMELNYTNIFCSNPFFHSCDFLIRPPTFSMDLSITDKKSAIFCCSGKEFGIRNLKLLIA